MAKPYRNTIKILYDILQVCTVPTSVTILGRKANMAHNSILPVINKLKSLQYIKGTNTGRTTNKGVNAIEYQVTDKGYKFAATIEEFANAT